MSRSDRRRAGDERPAEYAHTGAISEPELVWGDQASAPVTQLSVSGGSRLERRVGSWWSGLSRPRRAAALLAPPVLLAVTLYLLAPQPGAPQATPWPALYASVVYQGSVTRAVAIPRGTVFVVGVTNRDTATMTIGQITQPYRGLTFHPEPPLPIPVQQGQTVFIQLFAVVQDCSKIPGNDAMPFIDVTFSNIRAIQTESEILGDRYTADLHQAMTAACRRT
ncbi:hypothetical protein [Streptacidiphilus rugosus]|uniref:hypothetical protein n=1 Tax=Streptacidiphilus rugosus TaxID=405783 RepID=UPI00068D2844|nr:hypothetical protein [Streptacidiphilus rugosus]